MNKALLDKWLNGNISREELQELKTSPEFMTYLKIDAFTKDIEIPSHPTEEALREIKQKISGKKKSVKVRTLPVLLKVAAVLVLLLISYFFINSLPTTVSTEISHTYTFNLPDTSEVTLNSDSNIKYKEGSWKENRSLELDGEAYFQVTSGNKFRVNTPQGAVQVLGTKFNVLARGDTFEVKCFEGLVSVIYEDNTVKLPKGKTAVLEGGMLKVNDFYTSKPGWIGNESSFNNILIAEVLKELERKYSLHITTQNIDVNLRFTGSFTHKNLDSALKTITLPLGLTYSIEKENSVIIYSEINSN